MNIYIGSSNVFKVEVLLRGKETIQEKKGGA